jgi:D-aminopeptidase
MNRLLIIADMEGIAGIGLHDFWSTIKGHPCYFFKRKLLVKEINAAIAGAIKAGVKAEEIIVADWHLTRHNVYQDEVPEGVRIIRADENAFLEKGIEKVFLIGFHAGAGIPVPYAHSFRYAVKTFTIDDTAAGEATMWAYNAGSLGIPIALLTGDPFAVREIKALGLKTICVETKNERRTLPLEDVYFQIERAAEEALRAPIAPLPSPSPFVVAFSLKSKKMMRTIPKDYFTWRDGDMLVIEGETAHGVYDAFLNKVGAHIKSRSLGHRLMALFEK